LVYFIDWNIITLNGRSVIMTFLFDWISLLFMGFVFIISSLVILYSDDYMFGDLNIIRFISLVLIFVVSIIFLIISPNIPPPPKKNTTRNLSRNWKFWNNLRALPTADSFYFVFCTRLRRKGSSEYEILF